MGGPALRVSLGDGVDLVATPEGVTLQSLEAIDGALRQELVSGAGEGVVAYLRGNAVLHGSCVSWGGRGLSFVGPQWQGKSTLTAWLAAQGAELIADGMTIVEPDTRRLVWRRPSWRLDDAALVFLGHRPDALMFHDPYRHKRTLPAPRAPQIPEVTLDTVFVLEEGPCVEVVRLQGAEQIIALVRDWYLVSSLPASESAVVLERAARLLRGGVRVVKLARPKRWSEFPRVAAAVSACLNGS